MIQDDTIDRTLFVDYTVTLYGEVSSCKASYDKAVSGTCSAKKRKGSEFFRVYLSIFLVFFQVNIQLT